MVEANIKIIQELKTFLELVCSDAAIRELVTQSPSDFTRKRKLTLERLVGFIINLPKRSLSIELEEFFESLSKDVVPSTKGALSLQRSKLKPVFFDLWNTLLVDCFYHYYGESVKRWRGFRLLAVDGSTSYLVNRKEVVDYYGVQDNQHGSTAMARVMQIQDVLNDITVWGAMDPIKESEQGIIAKKVGEFYDDSLTLFDRGYPSFALMYLMNNEETPRHFVMRCKIDFNQEVKQFIRSDATSQMVEITPNAKAIATLEEHGHRITNTTTVKVRMVKVKLSSGAVEVLLTNLYDENQYSIADLKYLYGLRWAI